jgi:adenosyl cobinamide kinase/adenosyl cobinamide phosphate guanylyltransferase
MALTLLLGGARCGKSALAVRLAQESGRAVVFVATGEAGDEEMAERIRLHRQSRPAGWTVVEEPLELTRALEGVGDALVVLDCLSLWVANALGAGWSAERIEEDAAAAAARDGDTIAVSNEVGLGIVPATRLGREYRDILGRVNSIWAAAADEALLVVAGRTLQLRA